MRKRIISPNELPGGWLDLQTIATVEVTSEDQNYPIEQAFDSESRKGWRAGAPGEQEIRVVFDAPVTVSRIQLRFEEPAVTRTQEFTLRCLKGNAETAEEIVRQQWNFSAGGSTSEAEDYKVSLTDVAALELTIRPDLRDRNVFASLESFRLA
jgi:hypothetical protein